jgi:hypothetical protein
MTDETKKRRAPISYRPPKGREAEFYARAAEHGGSLNAFITDRTLGTRRPNQTVRKLLARILAQDAAMTDALEKLEPCAARDAEIKALLRDIRQQLTEGRTAFMRALGRKS